MASSWLAATVCNDLNPRKLRSCGDGGAQRYDEDQVGLLLLHLHDPLVVSVEFSNEAFLGMCATRDAKVLYVAPAQVMKPDSIDGLRLMQRRVLPCALRHRNIDDVGVYIHSEIPGFRGSWKKPHFVYTLGPEIHPPKQVKPGQIFRSGRVWAMLDLLLTSSSISEASILTKKRLESVK